MTSRTDFFAGLVWLAIVAPGWGQPAAAGEPVFRRHDLNPQSTYSACAAVDVNRDGKLDVVCGGWWYEAPTWNRRFLREVEIIRGRYDDFSNLPLFVNGDRWPDLLSANYRSETLYWIEHPGKSLGPWRAHVIEKPGPMETARLVDVDGDGRLDVLPVAPKFAAWWELVRDGGAGDDAGARGSLPAPAVERQASGPGDPRWIRHELPAEAAGHGGGFGDVNGDGRRDVVTPHGWLEAPQDRRKGTWRWHPDFQLHRDCGIPIFVFDVDGDGDNDLVWGRGHRTGMYWTEQRAEDAGLRWIRHAIDTSWSQAHSLLLADLDHDGRPEVIAGKRYLGHEGRDPGEYDPLVIYWYDFDRTAGTWHRGVISSGGPAGVGLDPKAVDLDGDGDVDVLVAGRSGLFWFENLLVHQGKDVAAVETQPVTPPNYDDHAKLLVYRNEAGQQKPVSTPAEWALRRAHILAHMQSVMGRLPDPSRRVPLDVKILGTQPTPDYDRIRLTYAAAPGDRVPAYLLLPHGIRQKAPAMLCLHQTTRIGKDQPAGLGGKATLRYAHELAAAGYVCLVPDYPSFGDYAYDFKQHGDDYASGTMQAIWNNLRAVDLLERLPEVDPDRIGCIGHSLGAHNAIFTAAFDLRIRAIISSCGFTAFEDYYGGDLAGWSSDRYMPRIRQVYGNDPERVPFDFHEVVAALAPRPLFVNAPLHDANFEVSGVKKVLAAAAQVYELRGAGEKLKVVYPDAAHEFSNAVRQDAYQWLRRSLR